MDSVRTTQEQLPANPWMDSVRTTQEQLSANPLGEALNAPKPIEMRQSRSKCAKADRKVLKRVNKRCRCVLIFAGRITTCCRLADYFDKQ